MQGGSDYPRGNPENPVTTDTLETKFLDLVAPRFGDAFAQRALATAQALQDCPDVGALFADLFPVAVPARGGLTA